jgi:hypothetical protein
MKKYEKLKNIVSKSALIIMTGLILINSPVANAGSLGITNNDIAQEYLFTDENDTVTTPDILEKTSTNIVLFKNPLQQVVLQQLVYENEKPEAKNNGDSLLEVSSKIIMKDGIQVYDNHINTVKIMKDKSGYMTGKVISLQFFTKDKVKSVVVSDDYFVLGQDKKMSPEQIQEKNNYLSNLSHQLQ